MNIKGAPPSRDFLIATVEMLQEQMQELHAQIRELKSQTSHAKIRAENDAHYIERLEEELRSLKARVRPTRRQAEWAILGLLLGELGDVGWPEPRIFEDGEAGWAFFVCAADPTSYYTPKGMEWAGTHWEPGLEVDCPDCGMEFHAPLPPEGTRCEDCVQREQGGA